MTVIPAIDIIDGKAVRLAEGDYNRKTVYHANPLEVAKEFEAVGFKRLHLVDLDGAKNRKITNLSILNKISLGTGLKIDFGGGIQTKEEVQSVLNAGACQCTIGSIAAKNPELLQEWLDEFNPEIFFVGADVMDEQIRISGWMESTTFSVFDFLKKMQEMGLRYFFCTDISKDGMLSGPSTDLYRKIIHQFPGIELTASGGVSSPDDIVALKEAGCVGAIVGKAIYENRIHLNELIKLND